MVPADAFLPGLLNLGGLGILAYAMFHFYRQDRKDTEKRLHERAERLEKLTELALSAIKENTVALQKLASLVDRLLK